MRVKYQTRTVTKTFSTNGGTPQEKAAFFQDIANALIDMGAPLDADTYIDLGGSAGISFAGEGKNVVSGAASLFMPYYEQEENDNLVFDVMLYGRNELAFANYTYAATINYGFTNNKKVIVTIHAVKSGDSFFFGIIPATGDPNGGCISFAITPMKRLSDPSVSLGYAMVEGAAVGGPDTLAYGSFSRTLPFVEGFNYMNGMFNFTGAGYKAAFPESDTGKIPLVPYFAGIEDIYYDKVYVSPLGRGSTEEKAFETDKGTFLIAGGYNTDFTQVMHNTFAFDITEAVNTAQ